VSITRAAVVVLAFVLTACGGDGLSGSVYRDRESHYRIGALGPTWNRLGLGHHNDLAWHSSSLEALVQVNATCDPDSDVPLNALTNHLLIGFTERVIHDQRILPMDRREALRTYATARLDGVERELVFYVLKKDDCVYDFALVAAPGASFEQARAEFDAFVQAFTTEPG
jgi:hypothetical protein